MDLRTRLDPVLTVAGEHAYDVDAQARFPEETVAALRESGPLGLTVSPRWGDWAGTPTSWWRSSAGWPGSVGWAAVRRPPALPQRRASGRSSRSNRTRSWWAI